MTSGATPPGGRRKLWTALKILNVRLRFILLMVVIGVVASQWDTITAHVHRWTRPQHAATAEAAAYEYYCPMHPSVIRAEPGNCPICGMPLVKRLRGAKAELPQGVVGRVGLSPYRIQLAGIATSVIGTHAMLPEIRTFGTIEVDERRMAHASARVAGRIDKLYVDYTGQRVTKGDPLVDIYSPDLVSTQEEYLLALKTYEKLKDGGDPQATAGAQQVLEAALERLHLWGVTYEQVGDLARRGEPTERMTVFSPVSGIVTEKEVYEGHYVDAGADLYEVADLSDVWMTAYLYEEDISRVKAGQPVEVTATALPGRTFQGAVSFVYPTVDPQTRTLRIRADVPNPGFELRPGMYVDARIVVGGAAAAGAAPGKPRAAGAVQYTCPMHPQIVRDRPGSCPICGMTLVPIEAAPSGETLAVPESAVIDTGTRKVVYVEREPGVFDAVEVELGDRVDGFYPVEKGLVKGDRVVTQGAFLVDAENRLNPSAGSYFGATGGPAVSAGGHAH